MCPRALSFIWFRLLELLGTIVPFSGAPIPFTSLFLTLQNFRGLECLEKRSTGIGEVLKVHSLSRLYFICFRRAWTRNWFSHPMPLKGQALDGTTFSYPRSVGRLPFHCPHRPTDLGRAPQSVGGNPISMDAGALILFFAFGALRFGDILLFLGYKVPAVLRLNPKVRKGPQDWHAGFTFLIQILMVSFHGSHYFIWMLPFLGLFTYKMATSKRRSQRSTCDMLIQNML